MPKPLLYIALVTLAGVGIYLVLPLVPALAAMEWGCRL